MSKPANPLELVDRYLQSVRFWLPKTQRQDEILAELGEDLRSQIDAREEELTRPLSTDEVAEILKRCGPPMVVAARLGPNSHLIGPTLFPIYWFVLKMVLFWILVPVFVFIVGPATLASTHGDWGAALGNTIGALWSGLFIAAGIITLIFAILERTQHFAAVQCKWDPLKLPPVRQEPHERKPSLARSVSEVLFGLFGLMWLLLIPNYPALILGPAHTFLKAGELWHIFYPPIVGLSVYALLRSGLTLARPDLTWLQPAGELLQGVLTLVLLNFILKAAGHMPNAEWQPFVALTDAAKGSRQYIGVAAMVNASILISLICAWVGICIASVVRTWQLLKYIRKRAFGEGQQATAQLR